MYWSIHSFLYIFIYFFNIYFTAWKSNQTKPKNIGGLLATPDAVPQSGPRLLGYLLLLLLLLLLLIGALERLGRLHPRHLLTGIGEMGAEATPTGRHPDPSSQSKLIEPQADKSTKIESVRVGRWRGNRSNGIEFVELPIMCQNRSCNPPEFIQMRSGHAQWRFWLNSSSCCCSSSSSPFPPPPPTSSNCFFQKFP